MEHGRPENFLNTQMPPAKQSLIVIGALWCEVLHLPGPRVNTFDSITVHTTSVGTLRTFRLPLFSLLNTAKVRSAFA